MQYAIFKWHFLTEVRFGNSKGQLSDSGYIMRSDTLFSALCLEALKQGGEAELERLYRLCHEHRLLLSDTLLYVEENYFLPKPILKIERKNQASNSVLKKAYKKLNYISAEQFQCYLQSLSGKAEFDVEKANQLIGDNIYSQNRVMTSVKGRAEALPYYVNTWRFGENAGLYVIVGYANEDDVFWLEQLISGLGYSGVGGKKSSGLGKFEAEDVIFLSDAYTPGQEALQKLLTTSGEWFMTLSGALPRPDEMEAALENAAYQVIKRSGFIDSTQYAQEQRKRQNLYILSAGSCFAKPFAGDIYNVAIDGRHPVYRYAQPLFVGVDI